MMSHLNILVVDDVIENIQMAIEILQNDTYHFHYATNGRSAIDLVQSDQTKFDLILLDVMMPELDGFETCKRIVEHPEYDDIPIIFLTAKTDVDSVTRGFTVGGSDYISKPYHAEELKARVKNYLTHRVAKKILKLRNIDLNNQLISTQEEVDKLRESQKEQQLIHDKLLDAAEDYTNLPDDLKDLMNELVQHHPDLGTALN